MNRAIPLRFLLLASCCWCASAALTVGQEKSYPQMPGTLTDSRKVGELKRQARTAVRSAGLSDAEKRILRDYYGLAVIAAFTSPETLKEAKKFPEYRKELQDALRGAADAETHNYLLRMYFSYLRQIVATKDMKPSQYSPAARYNAMLAIGQLNSREMQRGRNAKLAEPYEVAGKFMLAYISKNAPDALHLAAILGLQRHASILMADSAQRTAKKSSLSSIAALMRKITQRADGPEGLSDAANIWMRMRAVETLGMLGSGAFAKDIAPIAADESAPMALRCAAVRSLGKLSYKNAKDIDPKAMAANFAKFAHQACSAEISRVNGLIDSDSFDRELTRRQPSRIFENSDSEEPEEIVVDPLVQESRRQLLSQLLCVLNGVRGAKKTLPQDPQDKALLDDIEKTVAAISKLLINDAKTMVPEELVQALGRQALGLEKLAKN